MIALDFNSIRKQIGDIAECVETIEEMDYDIHERSSWTEHQDKYEFEGYIEVANRRVYTRGEYTNDFDSLNLIDFAAEDDELEEFLENYELNELLHKIAIAS